MGRRYRRSNPLAKLGRDVGRAFAENSRRKAYLQDRKECAHCENYYFGNGVVCTQCFHRISQDQLNYYYERENALAAESEKIDRFANGCAFTVVGIILFFILLQCASL